MNGRVSILTPSYNQANFLRENLISVRMQGPLIREHIVMDGGSSDGSVEVLRANETPGLCWLSEKDRGQSDALNKALTLASGEIIGWLNSDDLYCAGAVERAVEVLDANPGIGMVFGHCYKIDSAGDIIGRVDARQLSLEELLSFGTIPQPSCFIRRSVIENAGGVAIKYRYAMDYDLWLRLGLLGVRWLAIDEVWARFRLHDASKSGSAAPAFLPEVEEAMDAALRSPLLPPWLASNERQIRAGFHKNVALAAYANLDLASARKHAKRALAGDPLSADRSLLICLGKSFLGERLVVASRRLKSSVWSTTHQDG